MTAKQKANQARFKKVVAEAKKLRKKNPKLTQAQAVKQAWAIMYGKNKVAGYSEERQKIHKEATNWIKHNKKRKPDLSKKDLIRTSYDQAAFGPAPKVGAVKKKAAKKSSSYHKDTKSHNVNIRVISGYKKIGNTDTVEVGDIFYCSWGYDQTNIDFYKVVKKTKTGISIVPMSKKVIEYSDQYMTGKVVPGEVYFGSKPMRRKLNKYGDKYYISINSFSSASKWSGRPETFTTYA